MQVVVLDGKVDLTGGQIMCNSIQFDAVEENRK